VACRGTFAPDAPGIEGCSGRMQALLQLERILQADRIGLPDQTGLKQS
jgi:hypothetical protein